MPCGKIKATTNSDKISMELSSAWNLLIPGALFGDAYRETKKGKSTVYCYTTASMLEVAKLGFYGNVGYGIIKNLF